MVRVEADGALAHVHEALRDAHHEQAVGLLVVVAGQLAQHLRETCVVRAGADEAHGEDGVDGDVEVVVVRVLGQRVDDRQLRVGRAQEPERERDDPPDDRVAVVHLGGQFGRQKQDVPGG